MADYHWPVSERGRRSIEAFTYVHFSAVNRVAVSYAERGFQDDVNCHIVLIDPFILDAVGQESCHRTKKKNRNKGFSGAYG